MEHLDPPVVQRKVLMEWLGQLLRNGRRPAAEIINRAVSSGHNKTTLYRAKKAMRIQSEREGMGQGAIWYWRLPDHSGDI